MRFIFNLLSNSSPRCICKSRREQTWKILKLNESTTMNIHCTGRSHFIEVLGVTQSHNVGKYTSNPNKLFMVSHSWTCIKKPPPYLLETHVWLWDLTTLGISDELTALGVCVCVCARVCVFNPCLTVGSYDPRYFRWVNCCSRGVCVCV